MYILDKVTEPFSLVIKLIKSRSKTGVLSVVLILFTFAFTLHYVFGHHARKVIIQLWKKGECNCEKDVIASTMGFKDNSPDRIEVPFEEVIKGNPIVLKQNDSRILDYILKHKIVLPPSKLKYNLENPNVDPSMGQGQFIRKLLKNQRNGFFVECGALDGETRSNTLYMEKNLGWQGLLVEGDPLNFNNLVKKNRHAWAAKSCLAIKPHPHEVQFLQHSNLGRVFEGTTMRSSIRGKFTKVLCLPLFTLLSYLNVTTVDYFSLDVEGNELDVLQTIPFDSVLIKTISVEFAHTKGGKTGLQEFFKDLGYILVATVTHPRSLANDFIYIHPSLSYLMSNLSKV